MIGTIVIKFGAHDDLKESRSRNVS